MTLFNDYGFQTKNKKDSEKTTRNIIKISIKLGMLLRGDKFTTEEKEDDKLAFLDTNIVRK